MKNIMKTGAYNKTREFFGFYSMSSSFKVKVFHK